MRKSTKIYLLLKYFNVDLSDRKPAMDNRFEMMIVDDKKVRFCNGISVASFVERETGDSVPLT